MDDSLCTCHEQLANNSHECSWIKYMVTTLALKQNGKSKAYPNKMTCSIESTPAPAPFSFTATCYRALYPIRFLYEYYCWCRRALQTLRWHIYVAWPPLWSSGRSFWLQIQRSRVRFPALPDFLSSSGSGTGSTQPREVNWGATWIKSSGSGPENRD